MTAAERAGLAANLRALRLAGGLTRAELAARCGLTADTISNLENQVKSPRRGTIRRLARVLRVTPGALFEANAAD